MLRCSAAVVLYRTPRKHVLYAATCIGLGRFASWPVCLAGRRGRAADLEICVKRTGEEPSAKPATAKGPAAKKSFYRLLAGTMHDNSLLLHESLVAEQFPSPMTFRCTVLLPSGALRQHQVC